MTPRERDTLERILRDVACHNQRPIVGWNGQLLVWPGCKLIAADTLIDGVTFGVRHIDSHMELPRP